MGPPDAPDVSALVFAGGDPPDPAELLSGVEFVVAADSGLEHALALGVEVDVVVGDLDSVDTTALSRAVAAGATVEAHPAEKDATDLELALEAAVARGATTIRVLGAHGGRVDHYLANVLLLASPRFASVGIDARLGDAHVTVVRDRADLVGVPGAVCSLLPIGGSAVGVTTHDLRYPLHRETLEPGSTRGVSNEFLSVHAAVTLEAGVLLAVVPIARGATPPATTSTSPESGKDA
jgi:thiamine pyrophosphokinase